MKSEYCIYLTTYTILLALLIFPVWRSKCGEAPENAQWKSPSRYEELGRSLGKCSRSPGGPQLYTPIYNSIYNYFKHIFLLIIVTATHNGVSQLLYSLCSTTQHVESTFMVNVYFCNGWTTMWLPVLHLLPIFIWTGYVRAEGFSLEACRSMVALMDVSYHTLNITSIIKHLITLIILFICLIHLKQTKQCMLTYVIESSSWVRDLREFEFLKSIFQTSITGKLKRDEFLRLWRKVMTYKVSKWLYRNVNIVNYLKGIEYYFHSWSCLHPTRGCRHCAQVCSYRYLWF